MKKDDKNNPLKKLTKESPAARYKRVSSGIKLRPAVFKDKKRQENEKKKNTRQLMQQD